MVKEDTTNAQGLKQHFLHSYAVSCVNKTSLLRGVIITVTVFDLCDGAGASALSLHTITALRCVDDMIR